MRGNCRPEHNGFTSDETKVAADFLESGQNDRRVRWLELAARTKAATNDLSAAASMLRTLLYDEFALASFSIISSELPELESFRNTLLANALNSVNWKSLAYALLDDLEREERYKDGTLHRIALAEAKVSEQVLA